LPFRNRKGNKFPEFQFHFGTDTKIQTLPLIKLTALIYTDSKGFEFKSGASVVKFAFCAEQIIIGPTCRQNEAADQLCRFIYFCWDNYAAQGIAFLAQTLLGYFC
jgi:hypothetical protein